MTNIPIQHFSDDVWLENNRFCCRGHEFDLAAVEHVYVNFRVNSTVAAFLGAIFSFFALGYGYFYYGDDGYFMLIPLVICFGLLQYFLSHYVELFVIHEGRRERVLVVPMRRREWVYDIEDAVKARMQDLKSEVRAGN